MFGFGKKKPAEMIDLKSLLTSDELTLLVEELRKVANRVPGETSSIMAATAESLLAGDSGPKKQILDLCISALNMTNSFKEASEGNRELVEKLEGIKKG